ncbi:MAG TPA: hypothetical protein VFM09_05270 [Marmoricola sp.]|nr:hypothetical protein [Marmoricola sp.]
MIFHRRSSSVVFPHARTVRRAVQVLSSAGALLVGSAVLAPAFADTPAAWPTQPHVSGWDWLYHLLLIPLAVFVLVWLAISVPAFKRSRQGTGSEPWGERREWFGGPRKSVDAADEVSPQALQASEEKTGGASGRW